MAQDFQLLSSEKCFEGQQNSYSFFSKELQSVTKFCAFIPANVTKENPAPVLYFLSGVTYNEQSVFLLSGIQRYAAECNLIIVSPDTSPRGCNIPGEDDREDFGTGVGFYVDATTEGYKNHYRMYSFVVHELPAVVNEHLPAIHGLMSLCGHSMGGHGALICGLKNPGLFKSVSAFAAVSNPSGSPWGRRCYKGYLGDDEEEWKKYNATNLVATYTGPELYIRIDQGSEDQYLQYLVPEDFAEACKKNGTKLDYRLQPGYGHGFYFVSTFIGEHVKHHAACLNQ